jgi:thymidylate kinase
MLKLNIMNTKGKFIVFEGPDRGGKSTQALLLVKFLKRLGHKVVSTREPGGDEVAEKIRKILLDPKNKVSPMTELMLYEASRAQHTQNVIIPALESGASVVCERYTLSTCAYQGYGRGIDMDVINKLNDIATLNVKPDLNLVFLMSDKYFAKRGENTTPDRLEQEAESFRLKMRQGYTELAQKVPNTTIIDADKPVELVHADVISKLKEFKVI